jgi:hypothetical protein
MTVHDTDRTDDGARSVHDRDRSTRTFFDNFMPACSVLVARAGDTRVDGLLGNECNSKNLVGGGECTAEPRSTHCNAATVEGAAPADDSIVSTPCFKNQHPEMGLCCSISCVACCSE